MIPLLPGAPTAHRLPDVSWWLQLCEQPTDLGAPPHVCVAVAPVALRHEIAAKVNEQR